MCRADWSYMAITKFPFILLSIALPHLCHAFDKTSIVPLVRKV